MRNSKAKEIRKILGYKDSSNPVIRRVYRRFKKLYSRSPESQKPLLIFNLERVYSAVKKEIQNKQ